MFTAEWSQMNGTKSSEVDQHVSFQQTAEEKDSVWRINKNVQFQFALAHQRVMSVFVFEWERERERLTLFPSYLHFIKKKKRRQKKKRKADNSHL